MIPYPYSYLYFFFFSLYSLWPRRVRDENKSGHWHLSNDSQKMLYEMFSLNHHLSPQPVQIFLLAATSSVGKHVLGHRHSQLPWHTSVLHHCAVAAWSYTAQAVHKPEQLLPKGDSRLLYTRDRFNSLSLTSYSIIASCHSPPWE